MNHDAIHDALVVLLEGFRDNLWRRVVEDPGCCHLSADMIVWLLAHEFRFAYAGTVLAVPLAQQRTASLKPRDVATRLAFATSRSAPALHEPFVMGALRLVCASRSDYHSIAFVVHGGDVLVLQADRNRFSMTDWTDEDGGRLPPYMRAAHRVYGKLQWVPVARFLADVHDNECEPLCGTRCPRIVGLVLLVHERVLGTRATRGFDDAFVHGERVRSVLGNLTRSTVGHTLMRFMQRERPDR